VSFSGPRASRRETRAQRGLTEALGCRQGAKEGLNAVVLVGEAPRAVAVDSTYSFRDLRGVRMWWRKGGGGGRGRQSSPMGVNDDDDLAKSDEVEHFLVLGTDEEDAGEEVLAGGQFMADDWLLRGIIEKRCQWSHMAQ
jgi:hypothetical protein